MPAPINPNTRGGSPLTHKMGRKTPPPQMKARAVQLRSLLQQAGHPIPDTDDYAQKSQGCLTQMMGNDREGCCSETAFAKWLGMIASYRPGGKTLVATADEVSRFYHEVTGPGDNGTYMIDMFEYAMRTGFLIGGTRHKIAGYAAIDVTDGELLNAAFHWFEGVQLGVNLTQKQYSNFSTGSLWTYDGSQIIGGHSVPLTMRNPSSFRLATWAQQPDVARECVQNPQWAEEAYVCIGQDMVDAEGHGANAIDWPLFLSAMEDIKAGRTPNIPDAPPDPTPPTPPPGPAPAPHEWSHTFEAFGRALRIYAGYELTTPAMASRSGSVWNLWTDVSAFRAAIGAHDWAAAFSAAVAVLADLGISLPTSRVEAVVRGLRAEHETQPLLEKGPPAGSKWVDGPNGGMVG